jgi:hypothetical protein
MNDIPELAINNRLAQVGQNCDDADAAPLAAAIDDVKTHPTGDLCL